MRCGERVAASAPLICSSLRFVAFAFLVLSFQTRPVMFALHRCFFTFSRHVLDVRSRIARDYVPPPEPSPPPDADAVNGANAGGADSGGRVTGRGGVVANGNGAVAEDGDSDGDSDGRRSRFDGQFPWGSVSVRCWSLRECLKGPVKGPLRLAQTSTPCGVSDVREKKATAYLLETPVIHSQLLVAVVVSATAPENTVVVPPPRPPQTHLARTTTTRRRRRTRSTGGRRGSDGDQRWTWEVRIAV